MTNFNLMVVVVFVNSLMEFKGTLVILSPCGLGIFKSALMIVIKTFQFKTTFS